MSFKKRITASFKIQFAVSMKGRCVKRDLYHVLLGVLFANVSLRF